MRFRLAYAALALAAVCAVYGFLHQHLFAQWVWTPEGLTRLLGYSVVYWAVAIPMFRRPWFVPVVMAFVFVYSTWWCALYFHWWAPVAVLYFLGSCWMLGRLLTRGINALITGLAIWVFLISIAAHFPVNRPVVYAIAFALPYAGRFKQGRQDRLLTRAARNGEPALGAATVRERVGQTMPAPSWQLALLAYVVLAHWLLALKPEVSSDGLAMHLAIPGMIADQGRFAFNFHEYTWSLMPMGGDFAFTAAYLLGGEAAARLLNFALFVAIVAMVYRTSQRWLPEPQAALAAALFASTPLAELVSGSLFVENVWAVFIAGTAMALVEGELAVAGLLLGAAFSTKVGTSAYLPPAAIIGVMKVKGRWRTAAVATVLFVLLAAPLYFNAWMKTGNPMFPFENQVFRSPDFETSGTFQDVRYKRSDAWNALYAATFRSSDHIEGQDGALGFQYFVLLPALLILWSRRAPGALIAFALAGAVISFVSLPNIRYLYPALPLLSIGFAWLLSEIPAMTAGVITLIALNLYFFAAAGWYHKGFALFTRAQWNEYMTVSGPQRELVAILNRTAPGEPVAFIRGAAIADLHARAYSDSWHTYGFWKRMIEADEPAQVAAEFQELGIRHLITPIPVETEYAVVQRFVNEWTAPSGASCGKFELRNVLDAPPKKMQDVEPAGAGTYDDRDSRIVYTGAWLPDRQFKQASSGTITYSNVPGDSFKLFFTGTSIEYVYTKALNRGTAEVWIDRKKRAAIDQYSASIEWQQRTVFSGLASGPHTIEVRVIKGRNPQSSDYYVDLDAFVVK
jgi:hypothetical protein